MATCTLCHGTGHYYDITDVQDDDKEEDGCQLGEVECGLCNGTGEIS